MAAARTGPLAGRSGAAQRATRSATSRCCSRASAPTWVARRPRRRRARGDRRRRRIIVIDDGFQNPALAKDLSLLVIDGGYGFGNGRVMPAGPLREPVASGARARRRGGADGRGRARTVAARSAEARARARSSCRSTAMIAGPRVVAFAGIGRPEKFFRTLARDAARTLAAHATPFPTIIAIARRELERARGGGASARRAARHHREGWVRLPPDWRAASRVLEGRVALATMRPRSIAAARQREAAHG